MKVEISETEISYLLDLFREIKEQSTSIDRMVDEIEQAEELLSGLVTRAEEELKQMDEFFDSCNKHEESLNGRT